MESIFRFPRSPHTHHRAKVLLEKLVRLRKLVLDNRYTTLIDNAYYFVLPPSATSLVAMPPLPPMYQV